LPVCLSRTAACRFPKMSLLAVLKLGVAASLLFCLVVLVVMVTRTLAIGRRPTYAHPRGGSFAGILYAFGPGMLPWEKESAAKHIWTYWGGILYHVGILMAMLFLATVLLRISPPSKLLQTARILLAIGVVSGATLFIKRIVKPQMRSLSSGDDYLANILVDLLLFFALTATFAETMLVPLLLVAMITFIYIPFGKLRHCVFFFYSRILFGDFFGKRGVVPHPTRKV
jgi:nitrate reductase gamma subunit